MEILTSMNDFIEFHKKKFQTDFPHKAVMSPIKLQEENVDANSLESYGLPKSYINLVSDYDINAVSIDELALTPSIVNRDSDTLTGIECVFRNLEELNAGNVDGVPGFVAVFSIEADNIYLVVSEHNHGDDSVYFKAHDSGEIAPVKVADNIKQFLLIWANLECWCFTKVDNFNDELKSEMRIFMGHVFDTLMPSSTPQLRQYWFQMLFGLEE